jgi:hypothetical protein
MTKMNDESRLVATVWDTLSSFIGTGDKQEAANNLVEAIIDLGYDASDLHDAYGEDPYLDKALTAVSEADADDAEVDELNPEDPNY